MATKTEKLDLVCVGAILGAYGVEGEVRIKSFCVEPSDIVKFSPLWEVDGQRQYVLSGLTPRKVGFTTRLGGIKTKEAADALKGVKLFAHRSEFAQLDDDEFYHADLIGMTVYDLDEKKLGYIKSIQNYGAGDLIEVATASKTKTHLVPFSRAVVPKVDVRLGHIVVDQRVSEGFEQKQ
ncbi:MAG: ribosome maturation factor RimM [Aestuariivita sp.]|nr:ribosome maturation factor RimM [Aestuariivita sp.]MCY4203363.1 ribosome maturation factor RimM [Aestuariivita sp.]MCY4287602.1 ribosome maturation factor RimM [Aestuariivita sp.]MCY4346092.1 ribosome maturation factor RimM [Aestuariivita sp.]